MVESGAYSDANLAMALGGLSKGVNPLEMAAAYGVLATNGMYCKPIALLKIVDREGKVLYEAKKSEAKRVIDAEAAYLTTNMMQDVFVSGTASGMGIGRQAAGKTGTTDTYIDAWFVGYTPNLSTAVWVGDDNNKPMNYMYGSGAPLSIWHDFMVNALASAPAASFVNPGVTVPPEPVIKQDPKDGKDKKKDKDKDKNKGKDSDVIEKEEDETQEPSVDSEPVKPARRSMKDRVNQVLGKPVVSNQPTPAK